MLCPMQAAIAILEDLYKRGVEDPGTGWRFCSRCQVQADAGGTIGHAPTCDLGPALRELKVWRGILGRAFGEGAGLAALRELEGGK